MPILVENMNETHLRDLINDHVCAECGAFLTLGRLTGTSDYALICTRFEHHRGIKRIVSSVAEINFLRLLKGEVQGMETTTLQKMDEKGMLDRIGMAKFPQDLAPAEKRLLARVAINYGLDPLMGEATIYQGHPYVSIDGRYRKAQDTGELDGVESRPATKEERQAWGIPEGDFFFRAEVYRKGCFKPFVGWGRVRQAEVVGGKGVRPIETNPQRMAEKRSEAQALRKGFHLPLPSFEVAGTPEDEGVIESTAEVIKDTPPEDDAQGKASQNDTLTLGRVLNWCLSHGKQYDKTWFLKNQSYTETELINSPDKLSTAALEIGELTGWDGP